MGQCRRLMGASVDDGVAVERGYFLLADISGYSAYLSGVELEHSVDILADLLGVVVDQTSGPFTVAKLEGDAIFAYSDDSLDPDIGSTTLEAAYAAFASRTRTIGIQSTCPCRACKGVTDLDLKLIVHHGSFVRHTVARREELVGPDVVLAHRLLKNSVTADTGLRGYAYFTDEAAAALRLDTQLIGLIRHDEHTDDGGSLSGQVWDLASRWAEAEALHPVFVTPDEAVATYAIETSLDPPTVWEYMTVPAKLKLWLAKDRADPHHPKGVIGVGSTVHCVHGNVAWENEILDWKPYRYYSVRAVDRVFGESTFTCEIIPVGDHRWRGEMRIRPNGGVRQRILMRLLGFLQRREMRAATRRFEELVRALESSTQAAIR